MQKNLALAGCALFPALFAWGCKARYEAAVFADAPAAYWRLGESAGASVAKDRSGHEVNAAIRGITLGRPGATPDGDTAGLFNGAGRLELSPAPESMNLDGVVTFEAWMRRSRRGDPPFQVLFEARDPNDERRIAAQLVVEVDSGKLLFQTREKIATSNRGIGPDETWHHIVATRSGSAAGSEVVLFIDGARDTSGASSYDAHAQGQLRFTVGAAAIERDAYPFTGEIDEIAVYPVVLPVDRIQAHYTVSGRTMR